MVDLGEEAKVIEDEFLHRWVDRFLEEHGSVLGVVHQPSQELRRRFERLCSDLRRADEVQRFQGFVQRKQIASFQHRAEEGSRPRAWGAPQREHRHWEEYPLRRLKDGCL